MINNGLQCFFVITIKIEAIKIGNKETKNVQKLELTWIGKGDEPKLEPRILIESSEKWHHLNRFAWHDSIRNIQRFIGKIQCQYKCQYNL